MDANVTPLWQLSRTKSSFCSSQGFQREQLGFLLPFTEFHGKHDKGKAKEALPAHLERNADLCQQIPSARLPQTSPVSSPSVEDKEEMEEKRV